MDGALFQLLGSFVAIFALAGIALGLKLGRPTHIIDEAHAYALASEADSAFEPSEAALAQDGSGAILADAGGQILVLRQHGSHFAGRVLDAGARARIEGGTLVVIPAERRFGRVALKLGDDVQAWAARIDALHQADHA